MSLASALVVIPTNAVVAYTSDAILASTYSVLEGLGSYAALEGRGTYAGLVNEGSSSAATVMIPTNKYTAQFDVPRQTATYAYLEVLGTYTALASFDYGQLEVVS